MAQTAFSKRKKILKALTNYRFLYPYALSNDSYENLSNETFLQMTTKLKR